MTVKSIFSMFPVPVIFFIIFITFMVIAWSIASKTLKIVDQKIAEFRSKNFPSLEEKDKAKEQLKSELIAIKNRAVFIKIIWYKINDRIMSL